MNLEEQKEICAKQICLYVADMIENKQIKMVEVAVAVNILVNGIEMANDEAGLKALEEKMNNLFPNLPPFVVNII